MSGLGRDYDDNGPTELPDFLRQPPHCRSCGGLQPYHYPSCRDSDAPKDLNDLLDKADCKPNAVGKCMNPKHDHLCTNPRHQPPG